MREREDQKAELCAECGVLHLLTTFHSHGQLSRLGKSLGLLDKVCFPILSVSQLHACASDFACLLLFFNSREKCISVMTSVRLADCTFVAKTLTLLFSRTL